MSNEEKKSIDKLEDQKVDGKNVKGGSVSGGDPMLMDAMPPTPGMSAGPKPVSDGGPAPMPVSEKDPMKGDPLKDPFMPTNM